MTALLAFNLPLVAHLPNRPANVSVVESTRSLRELMLDWGASAASKAIVPGDMRRRHGGAAVFVEQHGRLGADADVVQIDPVVVPFGRDARLQDELKPEGTGERRLGQLGPVVVLSPTREYVHTVQVAPSSPDTLTTTWSPVPRSCIAARPTQVPALGAFARSMLREVNSYRELGLYGPLGLSLQAELPALLQLASVVMAHGSSALGVLGIQLPEPDSMLSKNKVFAPGAAVSSGRIVLSTPTPGANRSMPVAP